MRKVEGLERGEGEGWEVRGSGQRGKQEARGVVKGFHVFLEA